ncbi:MAG: hypothetical protein MI975_12560 [Cytophagales bacterium]|nr:hypothetical protein [Cytophagales bacterium]
MKRFGNILLLLGSLHLISFCQSNKVQNSGIYKLDPDFGNYWYLGKAELASFELEQIRYGEPRNGRAVLIFVTEDFSKSKQVKLDHPPMDKSDVLKVMKLNATRKFFTGIYPYSTMTSVFTPVNLNDHLKTIKLTTSSQEWCGHTFLQVNLDGGKYRIQSNSYFETEGDQEYKVDGVMMEDEIWTRIRLNPNKLPTGNFKMLPGSLFCRFAHSAFKPEAVRATILEIDNLTSVYTLEYPGLERTLKIKFDRSFPYKIQGWEETYPEGGQLMTTKAALKKVVQLDYWNKNKNSDEDLRKEFQVQ